MLALLFIASCADPDAGRHDLEPPASLAGEVLDGDGAPVAGARVTLADADGRWLDEVRSDADGRFSFVSLSADSAVLGASAVGLSYAEQSLASLEEGDAPVLVLGPDTAQGRWDVIGTSESSDVMHHVGGFAMSLPSGQLFYCHDTMHAVIFDPASGERTLATESDSSQDCANVHVDTDGRIVVVTGADMNADPSSRAAQGYTRVKAYDPVEGTWEDLPQANVGRIYPSLWALSEGGLLLCGGTSPDPAPDSEYTDTCEVFDAATGEWTLTDPQLSPGWFSPGLQLHTGEVLSTWRPAALWSPESGTWRAVEDMHGSWEEGHFDAYAGVVPRPDGSVLAIGAGKDGRTTATHMVERFDPETETWTVLESPPVLRTAPELITLPDTSVLVVGGGEIEPGVAEQLEGGYHETAMVERFEPEAERWTTMASMSRARHFHALTFLAADGRVLTTQGTGIAYGNFELDPDANAEIEAFTPPYLLRGPRPEILDLSATEWSPGDEITLTFTGTHAPTAVTLLGLEHDTHWVRSGVRRTLELDFTQDGDSLVLALPDDPDLLMDGWYRVFVLVDGIPSPGIAVVVR